MLNNFAEFDLSDATLIVIFFHLFSLSQYINAKLDEKGCDEIEGLEEYIPEEIQVKHAVETWKVAYKKSENYYSERMSP